MDLWGLLIDKSNKKVCFFIFRRDLEEENHPDEEQEENPYEDPEELEEQYEEHDYTSNQADEQEESFQE